MFSQHDVTMPETEPATEWIGGRAKLKVSPTRKHGILQVVFSLHLRAWADGRGTVASGWRFRVTPPDEQTRPLVSDVAYMSYGRLRSLSEDDREVPTVAPEIIIEILSPDDRKHEADAKRAAFLAWGVGLVLIVDPEILTMEYHDRNGVSGVVGAVEMFSPLMFPGLQLPLRAIFDELKLPES